MAATFKQTELKAVGIGEAICAESPPSKKYKAIFVCPYENDDKCPKLERYSEHDLYFPYFSCTKSPVIQKSNGSSVCKLVVDVNNPNIRQSLDSLGDYLEFRNTKQ